MDIIYDHYVLQKNNYQVAKKYQLPYSSVRSILRMYYLFGFWTKNTGESLMDTLPDKELAEMGPCDLRDIFVKQLFRRNSCRTFNFLNFGPQAIDSSLQPSGCTLMLFCD